MIGGASRQFEAGAQFGAHRFSLIQRVHPRSPPPRRRGRALVFGDRAPIGVFGGNSFELRLGCGMHAAVFGWRTVRAPKSLGKQASALAVLPVRGNVGARFVEMDMLVNMIDPRHRNEMMVLTVGRALFGQLDLVGAFEMVDLPDRFAVG